MKGLNLLVVKGAGQRIEFCVSFDTTELVSGIVKKTEVTVKSYNAFIKEALFKAGFKVQAGTDLFIKKYPKSSDCRKGNLPEDMRFYIEKHLDMVLNHVPKPVVKPDVKPDHIAEKLYMYEAQKFYRDVLASKAGNIKLSDTLMARIFNSDPIVSKDLDVDLALPEVKEFLRPYKDAMRLVLGINGELNKLVKQILSENKYILFSEFYVDDRRWKLKGTNTDKGIEFRLFQGNVQVSWINLCWNGEKLVWYFRPYHFIGLLNLVVEQTRKEGV